MKYHPLLQSCITDVQQTAEAIAEVRRCERAMKKNPQYFSAGILNGTKVLLKAQMLCLLSTLVKWSDNGFPVEYSDEVEEDDVFMAEDILTDPDAFITEDKDGAL